MATTVVIGGLAAGPAAAARAARDDPTREVVLVEAGPHVAWGICELPHLLAGRIASASELVPNSPERFAKERGVRVLAERRAVALDTAARLVVVRDRQGEERELRYSSLVLATGSGAVRPASGAVFTLRTIAETERLRDAADAARGARAAVLGAGYIGLEAAEALRRRGLDVTVVEREALPCPGLEDEARRLLLDELTRSGVEFQGRTEVTTGIVRGADIVVAALGARPEVELARSSGLEIGESGAIRTDERCETSTSGVFAAGDCAEVLFRPSGERRRVPLATVANRTGRVAGANAVGGSERYRGSVGALVFGLFGLEVGRVGLSSAEAEALGRPVHVATVVSRTRASAMPGSAPLLVSVVVDHSSGRIVGANTVGADGAALRLNLLAAAIDAGDRAADLADRELAYAPPFGPLTDPVTLACRIADRER